MQQGHQRDIATVFCPLKNHIKITKVAIGGITIMVNKFNFY